MGKKRFDKKRFEKIDGLTALVKIGESGTIYDEDGFSYFYDTNGIFYRRHNEKFVTDPIELTIPEIAKREWYVKKPFDIREELLARPDEWVGAYQELMNGKKVWQKVKFDKQRMRAVSADLTSEDDDDDAYDVFASDLYKCIAIEDVPMYAFVK